jgi:hypothetical protein
MADRTEQPVEGNRAESDGRDHPSRPPFHTRSRAIRSRRRNPTTSTARRRPRSDHAGRPSPWLRWMTSACSTGAGAALWTTSTSGWSNADSEAAEPCS